MVDIHPSPHVTRWHSQNPTQVTHDLFSHLGRITVFTLTIKELEAVGLYYISLSTLNVSIQTHAHNHTEQDIDSKRRTINYIQSSIDLLSFAALWGNYSVHAVNSSQSLAGFFCPRDSPMLNYSLEAA